MKVGKEGEKDWKSEKRGEGSTENKRNKIRSM